MASLAIAISLLPSLVRAQNDTSSNHDTQRVGWVSSPNRRGTSDILWSCFVNFLVCTWKCIHLNIPSKEESEAGWYTVGGWFPYWPTPLCRKVFFRKVKWMCVIAIAPEIGVAIAFHELLESWKLKTKINSPNFTLTHAFYALMGGFVIAIPREKDDTPVPETSLTVKSQNQGSSLTSPEHLDYYSIMSNRWSAALDKKSEHIHSAVLSEIFPATAQDSKFYPFITEDNIKNQSTSDPFTKAFAVIQCGWLVIQSIGRASQGLRLTELELTTLAFTMCAVTMYGFWWCKPFDAQQTTPLLCLDRALSVNLRSELGPWNAKTRFKNLDINMGINLIASLDEMARRDKISSGFRSVVFHTAAIAFSGIHLIAWNWDFPSQTVQTLWRTFSTITTCGPLGLYSAVLFFLGLDELFGKKLGNSENWDLVLGFIVATIIFSYLVSRLGLIVLIFYCFVSMPASVYEALNWSIMFPHFS